MQWMGRYLEKERGDEKRAIVLALALTLALFQPTFAKASVGAVPRTDKSCNKLKDILMLQLFKLQFSHTSDHN
jgi:hypothetical protein